MTERRRKYFKTDVALWVMVKEIPSPGKIQLDSFLGYRVNTEYTIPSRARKSESEL